MNGMHRVGEKGMADQLVGALDDNVMHKRSVVIRIRRSIQLVYWDSTVETKFTFQHAGSISSISIKTC